MANKNYSKAINLYVTPEQYKEFIRVLNKGVNKEVTVRKSVAQWFREQVQEFIDADKNFYKK